MAGSQRSSAVACILSKLRRVSWRGRQTLCLGTDAGVENQSHTFLKDLYSILGQSQSPMRSASLTSAACRATWSTPSTPSSLASLNVQTWLGTKKHEMKINWIQVMLTHNLLVTGGKGFLTVRLLESARCVNTLLLFPLVSAKITWISSLVFEDYSRVSNAMFANILVF